MKIVEVLGLDVEVRRTVSTDSALILNNSEFSVFEDAVRKELTFSLEAHWAAVGEERIVINERWPKDWWEALKERWFPGLLLRRFPVQYNEVSVDRLVYGALCPHLSSGDSTKHTRFLLKESPNNGKKTCKHPDGIRSSSHRERRSN